MNSTMDLLHARATCRDFSDRPVADEILEAILEAGVRAPSGGNLQPYSIIVVRDKSTAQRLCVINEDQRFIADAPVNLLFCIDWHRSRRWASLYDAPFSADRSFRHFWISMQDTIIAAQNICIAAESAGLRSCYVGTVIESVPELRAMFRMPAGVFPVVLLSVGYPDAQLRRRLKFPQSVMVHHEAYQEPSDEQLLAAVDAKYQGKTFTANEERISGLAEVCRSVGGDELAQKCVDRVRADGVMNMAQYYFGAHYRADEMPEGNAAFVELLRAAGLDVFGEVGELR